MKLDRAWFRHLNGSLAEAKVSALLFFDIRTSSVFGLSASAQMNVRCPLKHLMGEF